MADEREEKKLKALTINVFQKIAVTFIVAVAGVVTTLIGLSSHSQSQKLKNELSNKEVELNHAYNLLTQLKKELNDTKEQLESANGFGERLAIAIANLEVRTADLLAAKAELERQQEEEKVKIGDLEEIRFAGRVLRLLLDYEAAQRRHELLKKQLKTSEQQQRVARVSYRRGRGSTSQMLGMEDKRDHAVPGFA